MKHKRRRRASQERGLILDTPLDFATHGLSVFPAKFVGKQKLGCTSAEKSNGNPWGYSKDPDELRVYWARWPDAAIGLPTGKVNGLFVVETDTLEGHGVNGRSSLITLQVQNRGDWPLTREAESPTGSRHYYFKMPLGLAVPCSASKLGPGIDVRGDGGFIIAPRSVRPGRGIYQWLNYRAITKAPDWLLNLVAESPRVQAVKLDRVLDPELMAMLRRDAGMGISFDPDDYYPDDVDIGLKIECALTVVPSDNYYVWLYVGAAIFDALGDDGFELFDAWSQGCPDKYDESTCKHKWLECSKMRSIRVNTIFYYADEYDRSWRDFYRQELGEVAS